MALPDDVVERILLTRAVYVAFRTSAATAKRCAGVYGRLADARRAVLRGIARDLEFGPYDPAWRFERCVRVAYGGAAHETWRDRWTTTIGVPVYEIEEWKQERADGLVRRLCCGISHAFDAALKDAIVAAGLDTDGARALVARWKEDEDPPFDGGCGDGPAPRFWPGDGSTREEWQERHGVRGDAYPYGTRVDAFAPER